MDDKLLYNICNLKCSYGNTRRGKQDIVLHIDTLQISVGTITFFVGPSGVGKSTILETLGVMNNTVQSVDKFEYRGVDFSSVWAWNDTKLSAFRNSEFSFVFQDTNLMPNFSAIENVMTTGLFQGQTQEQAKDKAIQVLTDLGVDIQSDRSIDKFSGGQKQRIAFARALMPSFNVLFGDEPTGNLDSNTADDLMKLLKKYLEKRGATAIIVSHDLNIATKYADTIVNIQKRKREDSSYYGYVDDSCIYKKEGAIWNNNGDKLSNNELVKQIWG